MKGDRCASCIHNTHMSTKFLPEHSARLTLGASAQSLQEPLPRKTRGPSPEKTTRTREAIVLAAVDEFLEHGFAGATVARVAVRAGLAKGTPYSYFPSKEALFAGVVRHVVTNVLDEAERQDIHPGERLGDYFRRTLLPVMRRIEPTGRASVARLVVAEGIKFPVLVDVYRQQVFDPLLKHISTHARIAYERGELASDALVRYPHILVGPLWVGMIHNGVLNRECPIDIGDMFETCLDVVFPPR